VSNSSAFDLGGCSRNACVTASYWHSPESCGRRIRQTVGAAILDAIVRQIIWRHRVCRKKDDHRARFWRKLRPSKTILAAECHVNFAQPMTYQPGAHRHCRSPMENVTGLADRDVTVARHATFDDTCAYRKSRVHPGGRSPRMDAPPMLGDLAASADPHAVAGGDVFEKLDEPGDPAWPPGQPVV
jgi:hypothetical protein